ncbi:unnamed protein product, partial [Meganyctiphanes norvegica]
MNTANAQMGGRAQGRVILEMRLGHLGKLKIFGGQGLPRMMCGLHYNLTTRLKVTLLTTKMLRTLTMITELMRSTFNKIMFRKFSLVNIYQVISTPTDIFMVMEYASGGELFDYIKEKGKLKEGEARRFFQQIISGVDYCHRHMVVHRDLKPENLLLDHNLHVKIADFGLSNIMVDGEFLRTSCGSPNYAAPEVISGKLYAGPEVDVWSCGIILYALLCGTLPFDDEHVPTLFRKIKSGVFQIPDYLNQGVVRLLLHMLMVDPMKRATVDDIKKHEWFQKELPAYLFPPPYDHDISIIDQDAITEVCEKFQVDASEIQSALLSEDPHNQLAIAYHLIVDNKRFADINTMYSIRDFYSGTSPPPAPVTPVYTPQVDAPSPIKPHPERIAPLRERALSGDRGPGVPKGTPVKRAKWHLGIRSQSKPLDIMSEVYKAMKVLDFEWKVVNPFQVRVRRRNPITGSYVHMALQLYQVDYRSHLLDFKILNQDNTECDKAMEEGGNPGNPGHHVMEFFEMCAALITELAR